MTNDIRPVLLTKLYCQSNQMPPTSDRFEALFCCLNISQAWVPHTIFICTMTKEPIVLRVTSLKCWAALLLLSSSWERRAALSEMYVGCGAKCWLVSEECAHWHCRSPPVMNIPCCSPNCAVRSYICVYIWLWVSLCSMLDLSSRC